MKICYIHGALATPRSFNYMISQLPEHDVVFHEYLASVQLDKNIDRIVNEVLWDEPDVIIGHSLGGVIATKAKLAFPKAKLIAIATPFRGTLLSTIMCFKNQWFRDTSMLNPIYSSLCSQTYDETTLAIVGTSSDKETTPDSDGVVEISSATGLKGCKYEHFSLNHYELVMDDQVISYIEDHIW
jgi:esterase/lipase